MMRQIDNIQPSRDDYSPFLVHSILQRAFLCIEVSLPDSSLRLFQTVQQCFRHRDCRTNGFRAYRAR